jgi:hypothetical protein
MTERFDVSTLASQFPIMLESSDVLQASAGATGSKTATAGDVGASIGQLVALKPAG